MPLVSGSGSGGNAVRFAITATNEASPVFDQVNQSITKTEAVTESYNNSNTRTTSGVVDLNAALNIAESAFTKVQAAVVDAYNTYAQYAERVRDLSEISGTSAEQTSRFIQVLDDYQLSAEDAEAATRKLKENGLSPTIYTLASLADAYKKIKDPAQQMQFIQDNLGRGGQKWVNVLQQEGDSLVQQAEQVNKNLILSDQQIQSYEKQRLAMDALHDSVEGIKIATGAYIGQLILNNEVHPKAIAFMKAHNEEVYRGVEYSQQYKDAVAAVTSVQNNAIPVEVMHSEAVRDGADATQKAISSNQELAISMEAVKAGINGVIQGAYDNYSKTIDSLQVKHTDLENQLKTLQLEGWWPTSQKIQDVTKALQENEVAQGDAAESMQLTIDKMIFQQAAAGLDASSSLELARAMGMLDESSYAVAVKTEALHKQFTDGKLTAAEYAQKVQDLRTAVDSLTDKKITITVKTLGLSQLLQMQYETGQQVVVGNNKRARGGDVLGGRMYEVTEAGMPELLGLGGRQFLMMPPGMNGSVIPVGAGGNAGGGGGGAPIIINVNISSAINLMDQQMAQNTLHPMIVQSVKQAQAEGALNG